MQQFLNLRIEPHGHGKIKEDRPRISRMGTDENMAYRELVKPKDAELYWKIMPAAKGANVVAFEQVAA